MFAITRWTGLSRVADTSFLIACFDAADPRRDLAFKQLSDPAPIIVPPEVLTETLGVLMARKGYQVARGVWEDLVSLAHVSLQDSTDSQAIATLFLGGNTKLSWVDCSVVWNCRQRGFKALCFDPALEAAAKNSAR